MAPVFPVQFKPTTLESWDLFLTYLTHEIHHEISFISLHTSLLNSLLSLATRTTLVMQQSPFLDQCNRNKMANCLYLCSSPICYPYFCDMVSLTPLWSYYSPAHFYSFMKISSHNCKVFIIWCSLSFLTLTPSLDSYYLPDQFFNFLHLPVYPPLLLVLWKDFPLYTAILLF